MHRLGKKKQYQRFEAQAKPPSEARQDSGAADWCRANRIAGGAKKRASHRRCVMGSQRPRLASPRLVEIRAVLGSSNSKIPAVETVTKPNTALQCPVMPSYAQQHPPRAHSLASSSNGLSRVPQKQRLAATMRYRKLQCSQADRRLLPPFHSNGPPASSSPALVVGSGRAPAGTSKEMIPFFLLFARIKIAIIIIHARSTQLNCAAAPSSRDHLS